MTRYKVSMHVEYVVEADSPEEASQLVRDGAEFPLLPFTETNYCDWSEVAGVRVMPEKREV